MCVVRERCGGAGFLTGIRGFALTQSIKTTRTADKDSAAFLSLREPFLAMSATLQQASGEGLTA